MIRIENLDIQLLEFRLKIAELTIGEKDFFMLMGPTGAGKTVLLEAIAGLVSTDAGKILINGTDVTRLPPEKREVGIVYQDHALFPHLNVLQNIIYGLRFHSINMQEGKERLRQLTELLNIGHLQRRLPINLSGGEKQRVALARALIVRPNVLLLDEPFSALDPGFREEIRNALKRLHENTDTTFLMVSHDFGDALALADRGAVLDHGTIQQTGAIHDIFQKPTSVCVAEFVGMKNIFKAKFQDGTADLGGIKMLLDRPLDEEHGYVAIRPEDIRVALNPFPPSLDNRFPGIVTTVVNHGFTYEMHVKTGNVTLRALVTKKFLVDLGVREKSQVFVSIDAGSIHSFAPLPRFSHYSNN